MSEEDSMTIVPFAGSICQLEFTFRMGYIGPDDHSKQNKMTWSRAKRRFRENKQRVHPENKHQSTKFKGNLLFPNKSLIDTNEINSQ